MVTSPQSQRESQPAPDLALPPMQRRSGTLVRPGDRQGVGLHSGQPVRVRLCPAPAGSGRYFQRLDRPESAVIPATPDAVRQTQLSTELAVGDTAVRTVEHLLAALCARGVADARIEIDGAEVPLLDGSAREWVAAIDEAGVTAGDSSPPENAGNGNAADENAVNEPLWVREGEAFVAALPSETLRFSYGIDFAAEAIGRQWHSWQPDREDFGEAIAPARTFGLARDVDRLREMGLIRGGSLENALVCDGDRWLNPPLRFANEPVRHKILDLVGDLSLLGTIPRAHFLAYKASHRLHVRLTQRLQERGQS